jgi:hypothetical protein
VGTCAKTCNVIIDVPDNTATCGTFRIIRLDDNTPGQHKPVFIEDGDSNTSGNNVSGCSTHVNGTKLEPKSRRLLTSGDEITMKGPPGIPEMTFLFKLSSTYDQQPRSGVSHSHAGVRDPNSADTFKERYDMREVIGRGTCGIVHRAINRKTGEHCAVKVVDVGALHLRGWASLSKEQLLREMSLLRAVNHPNIISLKDIFQTEVRKHFALKIKVPSYPPPPLNT